MKIRHRVPASALTSNMEGKIDAAYQREVDQYGLKLAAEYEREQRKLASAEKRFARITLASIAAQTKRDRVRIASAQTVAWELVEVRRKELQRLHALMTEVPAPSKNRGSGQPKHRS